MGGFFTLDVAVSGLFSSQRNLDVVSHNLTNTSTVGYSRQYGVQTAASPMSLSDGTGMLGTGAVVNSVKRIRDEYLDYKFWSESTAQGEWTSKEEIMGDMEATFNEPSDSGFTTIMNDFYNAMQEVSTDPSSASTRAVMREKAVTLTKYFNSAASHFEELQSDVNTQLETKVEEINSLASQVQQLNRQIYAAELDGSSANDLRDQRGVLVDKLSKIVNIDVNEVVVGKLPSGLEDKHYVITISGKALIDHYNVCKLETVQRSAAQKLNPDVDVDNLSDIQWEDGNQLEVKGGQLRAFLDIRDGNDGLITSGTGQASPIYKGIPFYLSKLNEFVRTFAMSFNEGYIDSNNDGNISTSEDTAGHMDGYTLNSTTASAPSGIRFFTRAYNSLEQTSAEFIDSADAVVDNGATAVNEHTAAVMARYQNLTAKNFSVSEDIINDYNLISASGAGGQKGNITNINALLKMRNNNQMFAEGAPEDFMQSLVASIGIDSEQAQMLCETQNTIVSQLDNRRTSVAGVSINEELTNMVKFQQTYNASAKMIQTLSELYDTLVNKLGAG